jgi:hypothetical protein
MKHLLLYLVFFCVILLSCENTPERANVNDPVPWLKMTESEVLAAKGGEVIHDHGNDKDGTLLAALVYEEPWFEIPSTTAYLVDDRDKKIVQINLSFKGGQSRREQVISDISNYIGEPEAQGVAGNNAPSKYFAYWQRVGYTGVYQELSDRIEVYFIPVNDELDQALPVESPENDSTQNDQPDSLSSK